MDIPVFTEKMGRNRTRTPDRVIAAVRWDYEVGLLSLAQLRERYGSILVASTINDIAAGRLRPDIKASRFVVKWS
jgi:hypothetical protein